jgi:Glycosyltransferase family 87
MTASSPAVPSAGAVAGSSWRRWGSWIANSPTAIWAAFVLTHLWLGFLNLTAPGEPLGDVMVQYKYWAEQADLAKYDVGIDSAWVYPIVALLPMIAASVFGFMNYSGTWLTLVFLLDCVAFAMLIGWRRPNRPVAIGWWWIAFLLLLGPIAMGRIDSISIPIGIVAVLLLASRPRAAAFLLTVATWIKVWPAAIIAAVIVAGRSRWQVLVTAVVTSGVIVGVALLLGSGANVFSFITQQTGRGLQVESPVSTIWMWMSFAQVNGAYPYFDATINTFQVGGPGSVVAAAVMTPILAAVVVAVAVLGLVAVARRTPVTELLPPLSLALVTAFIAFNKVGSPQYMTWLAVPIILGLATNATGHGRSFRIPAIIALVIGGATQLFYPYFYLNLLYLNGLLLLDLTLRNLLLLVLFGWAVAQVWELTRRVTSHEDMGAADGWLPAVWPFLDAGASTRQDADD